MASDLLFVCTADRIRSPIAAALLERELLRRPGKTPWRIQSAGVHARRGEPAHPSAQHVARAAGIDLSGHRSQPVTAALLRSELVLAMTEWHRARLVRLVPTALPRTFTLIEFDRLISSMGAIPSSPRNSLRAAASAAHRARPRTPQAETPEDLPDPYAGPLEGYDLTLKRLADLTRRLADYLPPSPHDRT